MKEIKNQNGNVIITTLFMFIIVMFTAYCILQAFGVFVARRQAQNIADGAGLAAIQELRDLYESQMQTRVDWAINERFWPAVEEYQSNFEDPPSDEEVVRDWISDVSLQNQLLGIEPLEWVRVVEEDWFVDKSLFNPEINGDILYDTCKDNSTVIRMAARVVVEENNGETDDLSLTFPSNGEPVILLEAKKEFKIESKKLVVFSTTQDVPADAATGFNSPFDIDVHRKVSFNL